MVTLFVGIAVWVLGILFLVYVFNWLREVRMILKQIESNTRNRRFEESQAGTSAPKPIDPSPSEGQKYMPKQ